MGIWEDSQAAERRRIDNNNRSAEMRSRAGAQQKRELDEFVTSMKKLGVAPESIPLSLNGSVIRGAFMVGWRIPLSDSYMANLIDHPIDRTPNYNAIKNNRDVIVSEDGNLYRVNMDNHGERLVAHQIPLPYQPNSTLESDLRSYLVGYVTAKTREGGRSKSTFTGAATTMSVENPLIARNIRNAVLGSIWYSVIPVVVALFICSYVWSFSVGVVVCLVGYIPYLFLLIRDGRARAMKGEEYGIF